MKKLAKRLSYLFVGFAVVASIAFDVSKGFDRRYRAREAESGGTGLGLAIVKSCIESCKGSVKASNLTPNGFEITIELEVATEKGR
jgi:signal transduction histidine kinase